MSLLFRNWPQAARSSNTILFVVLIRKSKIYSWIFRAGQRGFYGTPFAPESLFLCPVVLKKKVKNSIWQPKWVYSRYIESGRTQRQLFINIRKRQSQFVGFITRRVETGTCGDNWKDAKRLTEEDSEILDRPFVFKVWRGVNIRIVACCCREASCEEVVAHPTRQGSRLSILC